MRETIKKGNDKICRVESFIEGNTKANNKHRCKYRGAAVMDDVSKGTEIII